MPGAIWFEIYVEDIGRPWALLGDDESHERNTTPAFIIWSMRATPGIHVEWVDDEAVALNPENGRIHYLNPPAALFYALVLENGYDSAIRELRKSYKVRFRKKKELEFLIHNMKEQGLLIDE